MFPLHQKWFSIFYSEGKNVISVFLGGEKYPQTTKGRGKAKLKGKESGTPPNTEALEPKGPNNLTHFPDW